MMPCSSGVRSVVCLRRSWALNMQRCDAHRMCPEPVMEPLGSLVSVPSAIFRCPTARSAVLALQVPDVSRPSRDSAVDEHRDGAGSDPRSISE